MKLQPWPHAQALGLPLKKVPVPPATTAHSQTMSGKPGMICEGKGHLASVHLSLLADSQ